MQAGARVDPVGRLTLIYTIRLPYRQAGKPPMPFRLAGKMQKTSTFGFS